jgi:tripartite-type tricarboxylate transporter receptor subunit TctC
MKLRAIVLSLLALSSMAVSVHAEDAADYPSKKIKMLLPFGAGGGGDVLGRLLADRMGKRLGQTIYVENRTGAAGTIGAQQAATSPPDGYTITIGGMTTHVLAPAVYPSLPYDPLKDFTTIGRIGTSSILLIATKDFPANDLRGLTELSKKGEPIQSAAGASARPDISAAKSSPRRQASACSTSRSAAQPSSPMISWAAISRSGWSTWRLERRW